MNEEKVIFQPNIITDINNAMTPTDLKIPSNLSLEEENLWLSYFVNIIEKSQWYIGALIVNGRGKHGEVYEQVIADTGLAYKTVRNCVWVYTKVDLSRRRDNLPFGFHADVAALQPLDQDKYLEKAVTGKWTRQILRKQLKEAGLITSTKQTSSSEIQIATGTKEKIDNLLCETCKPSIDEIINLIRSSLK